MKRRGACENFVGGENLLHCMQHEVINVWHRAKLLSCAAVEEVERVAEITEVHTVLSVNDAVW